MKVKKEDYEMAVINNNAVYYLKKNKELATFLARTSSEVHEYLSRILDIKIDVDLFMLPESDWKKHFEGQDYGSPVAPGDGNVYYGTKVPDSWSILKSTDKEIPEFTIELFYQTVAHEIGHMYSNKFLGEENEEMIKEDYNKAQLEILWIFETFSQFIMLGYLQQSNDKFYKDWHRLYQNFYTHYIDRVVYSKFTDWGTKLIDYMQSESGEGLMNYFWFQAKSFLMSEEIYKQYEDMFIEDISKVFKNIQYPLSNHELMSSMDAELSGSRTIFEKWD